MSLLNNAGSEFQALLHEVENKVFPNFRDEKLTESTLFLVHSITNKRSIERWSIPALEKFIENMSGTLNAPESKLNITLKEEAILFTRLAEKEIERLKIIEDLRESIIWYTNAIISAEISHLNDYILQEIESIKTSIVELTSRIISNIRKNPEIKEEEVG